MLMRQNKFKLNFHQDDAYGAEPTPKQPLWSIQLSAQGAQRKKQAISLPSCHPKQAELSFLYLTEPILGYFRNGPEGIRQVSTTKNQAQIFGLLLVRAGVNSNV
jgi:hypothetical protein